MFGMQIGRIGICIHFSISFQGCGNPIRFISYRFELHFGGVGADWCRQNYWQDITGWVNTIWYEGPGIGFHMSSYSTLLANLILLDYMGEIWDYWMTSYLKLGRNQLWHWDYGFQLNQIGIFYACKLGLRNYGGYQIILRDVRDVLMLLSNQFRKVKVVFPLPYFIPSNQIQGSFL